MIRRHYDPKFKIKFKDLCGTKFRAGVDATNPGIFVNPGFKYLKLKIKDEFRDIELGYEDYVCNAGEVLNHTWFVPTIDGLDTENTEKGIFQYVQENIDPKERFRIGIRGNRSDDIISKLPPIESLGHKDTIFAIPEYHTLKDDWDSDGSFSPRLYVLIDRFKLCDHYFYALMGRGFIANISNGFINYCHKDYDTKYPIGNYFLFCSIFSNRFRDELLNEYLNEKSVF